MTLIQNFLTNTYEIKRAGPGKYVAGYYEPGPVETILVQGSMQPVSARELKLSEEASRLKQYYNFFTDQPILTIGTRALTKADTVTVNDESYKVMSVESWEGVRLPYHKAVIWRESTNQ